MNKLLIVLGMVLVFVGCERDADIASRNLSHKADMFEINRRIVFYNGITSEYILSVEGKCSLTKDRHDKQLEVVCKIGPGVFKKHFLGISDNVTYFAEQLNDIEASVYHYKVLFKPRTIIPDIDVKL